MVVRSLASIAVSGVSRTRSIPAGTLSPFPPHGAAAAPGRTYAGRNYGVSGSVVF